MARPRDSRYSLQWALAVFTAALVTVLSCLQTSAAVSPNQHPFLAAVPHDTLSAETEATVYKAPPSRNVIDVLAASSEHRIFTRLLQRSRLIPIINRIQEFDDDNIGLTVLAPRDDAWPRSLQNAFQILEQAGAMHEAGVEDALSEWLEVGVEDNVNEKLQDLLLYHFIDRSIDVQENRTTLLTTLQRPHSHMGRERQRPLLEDGQKIQIFANGSSLSFGWSYAGGNISHTSSLERTRNCTRGVVVTIDRPLKAPPSFSEVVRKHPALSFWRDVMDENELKKIAGTSALSAFLPVSDAFQNLTSIERRFLDGPWPLAEQESLRVLAWHLATSTEVLYLDRLNASKEGEFPSVCLIERQYAEKNANVTVRTSLGGIHEVSADGGAIRVGPAQVVESNILTSSGTIHLINKVLSPYRDSLLNLNMEKVMLASNATRFVELIHRAGLAEYINQSPDPESDDNDGMDRKPLAFLAPRDEAIIREVEFDGANQLVEVIKYHFLGTNYSAGSLKNGMLASTELRTTQLRGSPQKVKVRVGKEVEENSEDISFGGVDVVSGPLRVGNDQLYLVSELMEPPPDPMQVAVSTLTLSTFVAWIYAAGLESNVRRHAGVTGFLPHNDAFALLGLLANYLLHPNSRDDLQSVVQFHLVDGILYSQDIKEKNASYPTLQGDQLRIAREKHGVISALARNNSAFMTENRDLLANNGVLHEVDRILLPPQLEVSIGDLLHTSKLDTMAELVKSSNFSWILDDGGPFVLLAPRADGFGNVNLTSLRADPVALNRFVSLHILRAPPRSPRLDEYLPLGLRDGITLESLSGDRYGSLALRRMSSREVSKDDSLGYQIGILGARGTSGKGHAAKMVSHGVQIRYANDTRGVGGVVVIDSALVPFDPNWFYAWGWIAAAISLAVLTAGVVVLGLLRCTKDGRRSTTGVEALEGEEE